MDLTLLLHFEEVPMEIVDHFGLWYFEGPKTVEHEITAFPKKSG